MKKIFHIILISAMMLTGVSLSAQNDEILVNAANNGSTHDITGGMKYITDDGGSAGNYTKGINSYVTVTANCDAPNVVRLEIIKVKIKPTDTLYIHDGATPAAPVICALNSNTTGYDSYVAPSNLNTSNSLCIHFVSKDNSSCDEGFAIEAMCGVPCVRNVPKMNVTFFKARNGVIYDTMDMGWYYQIDTVWTVEEHTVDSVTVYDTVGFTTDSVRFWGLNACMGDSIIIEGHGQYGAGNAVYTPNDQSSIFYWDFADGDTIVDYGITRVGHVYRLLDCFDLTLSITDQMGCSSNSKDAVRVRMAQMPIKTIYDLATICNSDSLLVNVGYEGDGATMTMKKIEFAKTASKTYAVKTFIPDGGQNHCGTPCFAAPVSFNEFPTGSKVTSKADICSICLNYEHSFMGDYRLGVVCPSLDTAWIKYSNPSTDSYTQSKYPNYPYGGGQYTGIPYGGNNDGAYDNKGDGDAAYCDSVNNMYGVGWEYCWSRNAAYTLVTGEHCDVDDDINTATFTGGGGPVYGNYDLRRHINSTDNTYMVQVTDYAFQTVPAPYLQAGMTASNSSFSSKRPSSHEGQTDYYMPDADFSTLVGCPLNGEWQMLVCDLWPADNGWVFSWSLDICGISQGSGCEYQVGIDSVTWTPDSAYGDMLLGHWRGATLWAKDSVNTYISSPDTAGTFPIHVKIYDEFGCVWDTLTRITTVWTPQPDLGEDLLLCDIQTAYLDATDRNTARCHQTFMWEPFGDTTGIIETRNNIGTATKYMVEVTNTESDIRCRARDSIVVNVSHQPVPNFDPGVYPLEGCEPFTLTFKNTSVYGDTYRWEFGDGTVSTEESPTHTYATGQYGFKYYITSADGCRDSLVYDDLITVFSSPIAKFSWEPVNPTVLHPSVQFVNMTEPQSDRNKYYWEIQYDKDNPVSYHTLRDVNPSFEWTTNGEDISGTYIARLIAKTDERGPSGHILECRDTIENTILLVNDFLQFPNVITANGDGVNDKFEIKNLTTGLGYPNNSLAIYNRWGKRVYYKENISSDDELWDPAAENMPTGTYFWRFSGKGYLGNIDRNGVVEVLK